MRGGVLQCGVAGDPERLMALVLIILLCTPAVAGAKQSFDAAPGSILCLTDDLDTQETPGFSGTAILSSGLTLLAWRQIKKKV